MSQRLFVDGASGTVGMALQPHLERLVDEGLIELIAIPDAMRKEEHYRREAMKQADLVVLCLPDELAGEAVSMLEACNPGARILDASAAHRVHDGWVYGLPELVSAHAIAHARRVANPGCFATACILGGAPLANAFSGLTQMVFNGLTGYSAGGRKAHANSTPRLVQFGRVHRHLVEIERFTRLRPVLTTTVGPWYQGMMVQTYIPQTEEEVLLAFQEAYQGNPMVEVVRSSEVEGRVNPQACNGTNEVLICVAGQPYGGTSVAVVLDNLGKGSAGAAAANLRLMLTGQ
ncbi:TPA: N-acetyl-gamma-glutamyl-phosphate reductase [Burkholderia vietnamiensis]|nr:N-acetyl-gamma-glutamyl-phosphate reductase [Burkholderia vietnamiensis]